MGTRGQFGLRRRIAALVLGDGTRALAGVLVPVVIVLGWIARATPPPEIRRMILELGAPARAEVLALLLGAVVVASAPSVRIVLASARLALLRALPLSAGWWQRTHTLDLLVVDVPLFAALGYGIAPIARADAWAGLALGIAGGGALFAGQVVVVAWADRPLFVRAAVVAAVVGIHGLAWASGSPALAAVMGTIGGGWALVRMRRPWPEPRTSTAWRLRARAPAIAWAQLLVLAWARRAGHHLAFVIGVQLAALAMVALASTRDVVDGPWVVLSSGVVVAGALLGASAVLVAVRAVDRDRWWFDAAPLRLADEHRGRALVAIVGAAPSLVLGTAIAVVRGAAAAAVIAPLVATAWAVAVVLDVVAGREQARAVQAPAWRRFLVVLTLGELLVLAVGSAALAPWIALALARAPRRLAHASAIRRRFELAPKDDDHG